MRRNSSPFVKYIGICATKSGKRSGKDTFAACIIEELENAGHVAEKRALADSLKVACAEIFNLSTEQLHGSKKQKESLSQFDWPVGNKLGKTGKMTAREILQYFGSEVMRYGFDSDVWINSVMVFGENRLKELLPLFNAGHKRPPLYILVPDVRFPNEAEFVDYLVDIYRPEAEKSNNDQHISEKSLSSMERKCDLYVVNSGGVESLKEEAKKMLEIVRKAPL